MSPNRYSIHQYIVHSTVDAGMPSRDYTMNFL